MRLKCSLIHRICDFFSSQCGFRLQSGASAPPSRKDTFGFPSDAQFLLLVELSRGRLKFASVASRSGFVPDLRRRHVDFASQTALATTVGRPALSHLRARAAVPLYLPLRFKRSPFCVVTPRPSPAGSPGPAWHSTFSPPSSSPRRSRALPSFPRFFFSLRSPSSSPPLSFPPPRPAFPRSLFSGHVVIYSFNLAARGLPRIKYHVHLMARI